MVTTQNADGVLKSYYLDAVARQLEYCCHRCVFGFSYSGFRSEAACQPRLIISVAQ